MMSVGPDERLNRGHRLGGGDGARPEADVPRYDLGLLSTQQQPAAPQHPRRLATFGKISYQAAAERQPPTGVDAVCRGQDVSRCQVGDDLGGKDALGQDQLARIGGDSGVSHRP